MTDATALHDLLETGLGRAQPDPSFDRFARLVQRQLGVPTALVSLVMDDEQVFPGALGLPDEIQRSRRTPLSHSFCQYAVADDAPLVVNDARTHDLVRDNGAVLDLDVIAYAGYPIHDLRGRAVGALCAIEPEPRVWTEEELAALADLAEACTAELRLRAERERARRIQHAAVRANRQSRALLMLSEAFADATSLEDVEETLTHVATIGLGARWTGLALADATGAALTFTSNTFHPPGEVHEPLIVPVDDDSAVATAARTQSVLAFRDAAHAAEEFPADRIDPGTGARVLVPMLSGKRTVGVVVIVWEAAHEPDDDERSVERALARYTLQAVDRVRLLEDRREVATTLQTAMLTRLPPVPGLELAATYSPAARVDQVGGDWYDAVVLDEHATVLMIGDVTGHDMRAAAQMGQLRSMLRSFAWSQDESPATLLRLLDRANDGLGLDATGTALVARLDRTRGSRSYTLTWSSAGHLPPLVLRADGTAEILHGASDLMLGVVPMTPRTDHVAELHRGDTLVLYTDGLVEDRTAPTGTDTESVLASLRQHADTPTGALPNSVVRGVVGQGQRDDVAVLVVRVRAGVAERATATRSPVRRTRSVAPGPASTGPTRRWVDDLLESCAVSARVRRDAMLLTSELVTNALRHGLPPVEISVRVDDARVRVAVSDASPEHPVVRDPSPSESGGRGMQLVARFATRWGVVSRARGKSVWFELRRDPGSAPEALPVRH
ncbi:SpoIIE family protein phosphatase [Cellulomonas sp. PhB143]|uniref:SpoIIE family protein phosphatase n=1 Tax=Cellulomonas sp. PhB143 TaxID=2485186 RepID=UPI000F46649D|nr:SpoIIE family protein phosphatase [Cellulomonas sp. PhB143]ROS75259.1 serine phosphatase RsbU (regulator of sigma subunit) [Cellulomonas sp. PhB143]